MQLNINNDLVSMLFKTHFIHEKDNCTELEMIRKLFGIMVDHCYETSLHCIRVSNYTIQVGKELGLAYEKMKKLWISSVLHDIGKSYVPDSILNKKGSLTNEEYEIVKQHSYKGYEITGKIQDFHEVSKIILHHHERYDGFGYPSGIEKENIPLLSRIITVADAFDAMTSQRPYRNAADFQSALCELRNCRGSQFDSRIVDVFAATIQIDKDRFYEKDNFA